MKPEKKIVSDNRHPEPTRAGRYFDRLKQSLCAANESILNFYGRHPIMTRVAVLSLPSLVTLDYVAGSVFADPVTFHGYLLAENYNPGHDGIPGTLDDVYSISVVGSDKAAHNVNFYASDLGTDKLSTFNGKFTPRESFYPGDDVIVKANFVNGEYRGVGMQRDPAFPSRDDLCITSMATVLASPVILYGSWCLLNRIKNRIKRNADKRSKTKKAKK